MCSDFLHLPVPLGHLLLARMSYIGRGFEFTSWGNNQLYEHPTDVHSLPQMLSDWCPLIFWVDAVFTCPVCLGFFGSQPGFTTEMYLPQVGFIGFLILHVTSCPPPFSQWCEQSQQLNEWQCILNCTFGMWQSSLPELSLSGTTGCTVTCNILSSCLLWEQISPWLLIQKPSPWLH